ncbi:similar to An15g06860 [Aspergillus luchuensis]|uniref:Similar to An15g06860 n=1 Tax=Aspergillus kawachii TaxID=1069201 RepID=A0A146FUK3_ASPKA|nr:similar to An15g06860 [Aspergillus luchuensis]
MDEESRPAACPEPPPLPYSLRSRKKSIAIFWTIFVIDTLAQPLVLYWALWYATDLSHNLGGVSVFEYFYRLYNLFRKDSRARPLNARKGWVRFPWL